MTETTPTAKQVAEARERLETCPFCGVLPIWKTVPDARSAEFVGDHRVLACINSRCTVNPRISMSTDGQWQPGKGTPQGIDRDPEIRRRWNTRAKLKGDERRNNLVPDSA